MTAMHHEPVADRLGVPRHPLPADWRQRGGGGGGGRSTPPRSGAGCGPWLIGLAVVAVAIAVAVL